MSHKPIYYPSQRVDLPHFRYGVSEFPLSLQKEHSRSFYGAGVVDGFRIEVPDQSGSLKGHLIIHNGRGKDWEGNYISDQTGSITQEVYLPAPSTEYWIEIETIWLDSQPDAVAFFDSTIENTPPIPNGQEVVVPHVYTRETLSWRVRQPINNNPVGKRSDPGYVPAHFSPPSESVIPLAVIRTNPAGQILSGDPDTDDYGNDIVSVLVPSGTKQFIKIAGYNEPKKYDGGNVPIIYGRKFSDQRPLTYNPLLPMFSSASLATGTYGAYWAKDVASMFDHLQQQIGQIKKGANLTDYDLGHFHLATLYQADADWNYIDVKNVFANSGGFPVMTLDPDQLIGTTFQIMLGDWLGFYAEVRGNDRTDPGTGYTRIYLGRKTSLPESKELPLENTYCRLVQHRNVNPFEPPTPSTGNRGLDALDDEVFSSRSDWWSGRSFGNLRSRLNANKYSTVTVAPPAPKDVTTDEPISSLHPRADYFETVSDIRNAVQNATAKGGTIQFRAGTYTFDSIAPASTVFSITSRNGIIFEGDSKHTTILQFNYNTGDPASVAGNVFNMQTCYGIEFRNMTIRSKGTPISMTGCALVRFVNCYFESESDGTLTTPAMYFGSANSFEFINCEFKVRGAGLSFIQFLDSRMENCRIIAVDSDVSKLNNLVTFGLTSRSFLTNIWFEGITTQNAITLSDCEDSVFTGWRGRVNTLATYSKIETGNLLNCGVNDIILKSYSTDTNTEYGLKTGYVTRSTLGKLIFYNVRNGIYCNGELRQSILDNFSLEDINSGGKGIYIQAIMKSLVDKGVLRFATGNASTTGVEIGQSEIGQLTNIHIEGSSGEIGYGIRLRGTAHNRFFVETNYVQNSRFGIYCDRLNSARSLSISRNKIYGGGSISSGIPGAGIWMQLSSSASYCRFTDNEVAYNLGIGFTAEVTGVDMRYLLFDHNTFHGTERGFELWCGAAGGTLQSSSISNNVCVSYSFAPMVIGGSASVAVPAGSTSPLRIESCNINSNEIEVLSTNCEGALFVANIVRSNMLTNTIYGSAKEYGIGIWGGEESTVAFNKVGNDVANGHGIAFLADNFTGSIIGNNIWINGVKNGMHAVSSALLKHTSIIGNQVYNHAAMGTGVTGFFLRGMEDCTIVGNIASRTDVGFDGRDSTKCIWSGNHAWVNIVGGQIGFDITGGTRNRSGSIDLIVFGSTIIPGVWNYLTGAPHPPGWIGGFVGDGPGTENSIAFGNTVEPI